MADLVLDDVTVRFDGVTAVDGVDLRVREGELLALVGPSGCGKTTLLRTIAGLESPDDGEVVIDGRRVTDLPARRRDVSLVFQDFALFPHLTARENLSFDLRMQGADDVDARVQEAAELLDVADLLERPIDELSGGQKQRVALGRAMVTEPAAFLLDEPLSNLDASLRQRMQREIRRLHDHLGTATVHVTHDQAEALALGERVAVVMDGRVQQVGTPEAVYERPASLAVARFVGSPDLNCLAGRYDADVGSVAVRGWPLDVPAAADEALTADEATADEAVAVDEPAADEAVAVDEPAADDAVRAETARDGTPGADAAGADAVHDQTVQGEPGGDRRVVLGVRPEHVRIDEEAVDAADRTSFEATVLDQEFGGADRYVYLARPDGDREPAAAPGVPASDDRLVARVPATVDVDVGDAVPVSIPPEHVHYFDATSGDRLPLRVDGAEVVLAGTVDGDSRGAPRPPDGDRS